MLIKDKTHETRANEQTLCKDWRFVVKQLFILCVNILYIVMVCCENCVAMPCVTEHKFVIYVMCDNILVFIKTSY